MQHAELPAHCAFLRHHIRQAPHHLCRNLRRRCKSGNFRNAAPVVHIRPRHAAVRTRPLAVHRLDGTGCPAGFGHIVFIVGKADIHSFNFFARRPRLGIVIKRAQADKPPDIGCRKHIAVRRKLYFPALPVRFNRDIGRIHRLKRPVQNFQLFQPPVIVGITLEQRQRMIFAENIHHVRVLDNLQLAAKLIAVPQIAVSIGRIDNQRRKIRPVARLAAYTAARIIAGYDKPVAVVSHNCHFAAGSFLPAAAVFPAFGAIFATRAIRAAI